MLYCTSYQITNLIHNIIRIFIHIIFYPIQYNRYKRIFIKICSKENDLVVVPFAGSGTECAMALKEKRNFIGFEIEEKHVNTSNKRIELIKSKPQLF